MTFSQKFYLLLSLLINSSIVNFTTCAQDKQQYEILKLEKNIGREEVSSVSGSEDSSTHITITAQDRGYSISLIADVKIKNDGFKINSKGQTSRFKQQNLDTVTTSSDGFPLINNGSIKIKEMLVAYWIKKGKPTALKSTLNGSNITVRMFDTQVTANSNHSDLSAFLINNGLDEILWLDKKGKAVFLTTIDSEGDKREILSKDYLSDFKTLNQQSSQLLNQSYREANKDLGEKHPSIAIIGANLIDITGTGKLLRNTMVLIHNGKIEYVGATDKSIITPGAKIIDASDKFLLPGLWDMHSHIFHPSYLQRQLLSGVTSVRDMANEFDLIVKLKDMVGEGTVPAPDLYAAGVLDGKSETTLGTMLATSAEDIKKNIKRYHDAGFDQIKIYDNIKKRDFNTIVDIAISYQMDVVGHLPTGYTLNYFINNGMKSISHIHFFMNSINWTSKDLKATNQLLIDSLIAHHIYLDPTLNVYKLIGDKRMASFRKLVKLFADSGIPIVAGTDNEGSISDEIENYVQLGMSPLEAIKTATIVPARVMGVSDTKGSIDVGKDGDILILNDNPLQNPNALKNIKAIIKGQFVISY